MRYNQRLAEAGAVASVGSTGDSYDHALAEASNSLFEAELVRNKASPVERRQGATDPESGAEGLPTRLLARPSEVAVDAGPLWLGENTQGREIVGFPSTATP